MLGYGKMFGLEIMIFVAYKTCEVHKYASLYVVKGERRVIVQLLNGNL